MSEKALSVPIWCLRTSASSPFGRKVLLAISAIGMTDQLKVEPASASDEHDTLRHQNPLGKMPVLILQDGQPIFDSSVIVDFVNTYDGRSILIPGGQDRYAVLREQALADGIMDAALLLMYEERFRDATKREIKWINYQQQKIVRALWHFEQALPKSKSSIPHIGEITLAAALGYLDFRFQGAWRTGHPNLVSWVEQFNQRLSEPN